MTDISKSLGNITMSAYKVIVKNKAGTSQWELPFENGQVVWNLNNIHTCSLVVDMVYLRDYLVAQSSTLKTLFETGWLNFYLYKDNVLLFAGYIASVTYSVSGGRAQVRIDVKSWLGYFASRFYTGDFSATDAGDIAWGLINAVNDISITKGTVTATKTRDRSYKNDEVAKSVIGLSYLNLDSGFDFDISNAKVFTAVPRLGSDFANIVFDEADILSYSIPVGLVGTVINKGIIFGGGIGDSQVIRTYTLGAPYTTNWFTLEGKTQSVNVEDTTVLDDAVTQLVELRKNPVRTIKLKVTNKFVDDYNVGDGIKIKIPDLTIDDILRVKKKTLNFGDEDTIDLEFL